MILIIKKHDLKYFQRFLILLSLKLSRQILDDCNLTWKCLESSLFCIHAIVSLSELTVRLFILNAHNSDSSTMGTCYDPSCCFLSRKSVCMIFLLRWIDWSWNSFHYMCVVYYLPFLTLACLLDLCLTLFLKVKVQCRLILSAIITVSEKNTMFNIYLYLTK